MFALIYHCSWCEAERQNLIKIFFEHRIADGIQSIWGFLNDGT